MTNPIADPLVEVPDTTLFSGLVSVEATPDGVATLTLNRADKKNAFNDEVIAALNQALDTLHQADGVRIVFLQGAGDTFSAGADLDWMRGAFERTEADNVADAFEMAKALKALHDLPALTVALVQGAAFGGGAGLVAACDFAVATKDARFGFTEVKLGIIAATISPYVVAAVGPRTAKQLFATGRLFSADEALRYGLLHQVVDGAAGLAAAKTTMAASMGPCAPGAIGASKALVDHVYGHKIDHGLMMETARRIAEARVSEEGQEGLRAFLDRRKPNWA
jgi:methylglutaconyl-CoA hydratase